MKELIPYKKNELHGLKGTLYLGVDCAEDDDGHTEILAMHGEDGKLYIISSEHYSAKTSRAILQLRSATEQHGENKDKL